MEKISNMTASLQKTLSDSSVSSEDKQTAVNRILPSLIESLKHSSENARQYIFSFLASLFPTFSGFMRPHISNLSSTALKYLAECKIPLDSAIDCFVGVNLGTAEKTNLLWKKILNSCNEEVERLSHILLEEPIIKAAEISFEWHKSETAEECCHRLKILVSMICAIFARFQKKMLNIPLRDLTNIFVKLISMSRFENVLLLELVEKILQTFAKFVSILGTYLRVMHENIAFALLQALNHCKDNRSIILSCFECIMKLCDSLGSVFAKKVKDKIFALALGHITPMPSQNNELTIAEPSRKKKKSAPSHVKTGNLQYDEDIMLCTLQLLRSLQMHVELPPELCQQLFVNMFWYFSIPLGGYVSLFQPSKRIRLAQMGLLQAILKKLSPCTSPDFITLASQIFTLSACDGDWEIREASLEGLSIIDLLVNPRIFTRLSEKFGMMPVLFQDNAAAVKENTLDITVQLQESMKDNSGLITVMAGSQKPDEPENNKHVHLLKIEKSEESPEKKLRLQDDELVSEIDDNKDGDFVIVDAEPDE